MKNFLIFLLLFITSISFAQQEVKMCYNEKQSFIYRTNSGELGTYWWEIDGVVYQMNQNNIIVDWNDYSFGNHIIEAFFISDDGCYADPVYFEVNVLECPQSSIWFPNSFTPNSDGVNDIWFPSFINITSLDLRIFDRWGELLYYTNDFNGGWDGYYHSQICQVDVYVYLATWTTIEGDIKTKVGHIILIK